MAVVLTLHDAFPLQCRIQVLARFHAYAVQLCQGIESVFLDEAQKVFQQIDVILPELRRILGVISSTARASTAFSGIQRGCPASLERYDNPHRSTVDVPFGQKRPAVPVSHPNCLKLLPFLRHGIPIRPIISSTDLSYIEASSFAERPYFSASSCMPSFLVSSEQKISCSLGSFICMDIFLTSRSNCACSGFSSPLNIS